MVLNIVLKDYRKAGLRLGDDETSRIVSLIKEVVEATTCTSIDGVWFEYRQVASGSVNEHTFKLAVDMDGRGHEGKKVTLATRIKDGLPDLLDCKLEECSVYLRLVDAALV